MQATKKRSLKATQEGKELALNARIDRFESEHDRIAEAQASPEGYELKPGDRHLINDLVNAYSELEALLLGREEENQVIPDHPLVTALGKAICINDLWGAVQIIGQLVKEAPEFLKKIWWKVIPPKKDRRKPEVAERAKLVDGRAEPPLDPMKLNPMPDIGLPVASDFQNKTFGSGFSPAPSEFHMIQEVLRKEMEASEEEELCASENPEQKHDPP